MHINRVPETVVTRWWATLSRDDVVERLERTQLVGDSVTERVVVTLAHDTLVTERTRGDSVSTWRVNAPGGALPRHASSDAALLDVLTRRIVARDLAVLAVPSVFAGDSSATVDSLVRGAGDTVRFGTQTLRIDAGGHLTRMGPNVERTSAPDMAALLAAFATRPLGALSPDDSVAAVIDGASIRVRYGRPWKRGREIFGGLVPWDAVWRTGAGNATLLTTDRDVVIGGTRVPAGTYSVFTLPSAAGWKLILSTRTGADAAIYSPEADFARIDMASESLPETVEQFTIAVEATAPGGRLRLSWDRTAATVTIARR